MVIDYYNHSKSDSAAWLKFEYCRSTDGVTYGAWETVPAGWLYTTGNGLVNNTSIQNPAVDYNQQRQ